MSMLSQAEALQFLQDVLEINSIQEKLVTSKAALLDEIIDIYQQKMPFQTITTIARPEEEQRVSTMEDTKNQMFNSHGGICYNHNVFMKILLEALGFTVYFIACDVESNGVNDHIVVIVQNLENHGDLHHVDVGSAKPMFRAIPLNFENESPVYKSGFLTHKFVKAGGVYNWLHKVDHANKPIDDIGTIIGGWRKFMTFTLEPQHIDYFNTSMQRHFITKMITPSEFSFLKSLRAVCFPDHKLVAFVGTTLLLEDGGKVQKTKIQSKEELINLFGVYFPQFPSARVNTAIDQMKYDFGM